MHEDLQYLRERVDGIADTLAKNTAVLEANTSSLREHMRRTELLETRVERLYHYKYMVAGAVAIIAAFGSLVLEYVSNRWFP